MYAVRIEKRCLRDLKRLQRPVAERALGLIESVIAVDPYPGKGLSGPYKGLWSYRFADYRIIYGIHAGEISIVVLRARRRPEVYGGL